MVVVTYGQKEDKRTKAGAIALDEFLEGGEEVGACKSNQGILSICLRGWGRRGERLWFAGGGCPFIEECPNF
jgi:hypothetical protein